MQPAQCTYCYFNPYIMYGWVNLSEFVVLTFAEMPFVRAKWWAAGSGRGGVSLS